jgi:multiple sugar transport system ATP-binding protein
MAGVTLRGLTTAFAGGVRAVDGIDLDIRDDEFFALLGPSGCGKTTLLRTIAGLQAPTAGTIHIGGRDVTRLPPGARDLAMVFQDYALYPHMTVADNIAYPLKVRKVPRQQRLAQAADAAASLQLGALLDRRPGQLSGGQQQRVALARAIVYRPSVFLFDEPLSNLDARLRLEARTFLKRLQTELGVTTIYVTHDQAEALALADRMAVMDAGRLRQVGAPVEIYQRPVSRFVASFIGSVPMNLLDAIVEGDRLRVAGQLVPLPGHARGHVRDGEEVTLGVRPEHAVLRSTAVPGALAGTVRVVELLGTDYLITVEAGERSVQVTDREAPQLGEQVRIELDGAHPLLYRADDGLLVGSDRRSAASGPP